MYFVFPGENYLLIIDLNSDIKSLEEITRRSLLLQGNNGYRIQLVKSLASLNE